MILINLLFKSVQFVGIITFIVCYFFGAQAAGNKFIEKHKHKTFNTKFNALVSDPSLQYYHHLIIQTFNLVCYAINFTLLNTKIHAYKSFSLKII